MPILAEHALHAEGPRFVGHDRHDVLADPLVAAAAGPAAARRPSWWTSPCPRCRRGTRGTPPSVGTSSVGDLRRPAGHEAAQRLAPFAQVADLRAVVGRPVERRLRPRPRRRSGMPKRLRNSRSSSRVGLLLLVGDVAALAGLAQPVALDGLGQDHRRPALVLDGRLVGGVDLLRVVAAAAHLSPASRPSSSRPASAVSGYLPKKCSRM